MNLRKSRNLPADPTEIRDLADRFLAAETTLDEERRLYAYFNRPEGDIHPSLLPLREMFAWYGTLAPAAEADGGSSSPTARPFRLLPLTARQWFSTAAAILILLTVGYFTRSSLLGAEAKTDYDLAYRGSYIISNGQKITDLSVVVPEAERLEEQLERRINAINRRVNAVEGRTNTTLTTGFDLSNPHVRALMEDALN